MSRVPPHSAAAEEAVVGICLVSPEAVREVMNVVQWRDFYVPESAALFAVMERLMVEGAPIDPITVATRSRVPVKKLDDLARPVFDAVAVALDAAELVARKAAHRRAIAFAEAVTEAAHAENDDALDELLDHPLDDILPEQFTPPVDVMDLIAMTPSEPEFVLAKVLARLEVVLLIGNPGHGKSTLLRQIAVCAASGLTPFHRSATEARRVLYVDCQDSPSTVAASFRSLIALAGSHYQAGLHVEVRPQGLDLSSTIDRRWLDDRVARTEADLVILGPLYNLVRGNDRRSKHSEETAEMAMNALNDLMVRRNCALMIEGHAPHGTELRPRGSKLWEDFPAFGFGLVREDSAAGRGMVIERFRGDRYDGRPWPTRFVQGVDGSWPWEAVS